jgi:hypothetical protein
VKRESVILPPAFAIAQPAEQVGGEHRSVGIDHGLLGGDIVA